MRFEREAAPVRVHECCRRRNKFRCSKILMVISESRHHIIAKDFAGIFGTFVLIFDRADTRNDAPTIFLRRLVAIAERMS